MKRKISCLLTALLLAVSIVSLPAYAAQPAGTFAVQEDFYRQLAGLVGNQDYSKFFDEMELRIGSEILSVDGETQILDAAPEIRNDRTMLPIGLVARAAGADVAWEPSTATVRIESASGDIVSFSIGSSAMTINDQSVQMDVTPYIKQDRTYMPIWAVADALELDVDWIGETRTVRLTAPYQSGRLIVLADQLDTQGLDAETVISDGTGMWVLQFDSPAQAKTAAKLLESRGVVAEPDLYIPPVTDPTASDTAAAGSHYSWGVGNCGFDGFISKYSSQFKGKGVVAVVDTGVDSSHSFLRGRVLSGGYDFIDGDTTPNDGHSHGTHVAGTIIDCVGSAPVSILPVRVLNNQGRGSSVAVIAGIKYAADHGADVINLSLGGGCSKAQDNAISYAIGKGCLVVAAAGNENTNTVNSCPAHITTAGTVVVSAGDSGHKKAYFSNYGSSVDLMAPGVDIRAAVPGGGFGNKSGTSMAAPHAAAAAMLIDLAWGKTLTPAALEARMREATTYGKWTDQNVGCGFLDLSKLGAPAGVKPGISLDRSSLSMKPGESQTLAASVTPNGTAVSWSSSNPSVASVSNGRVTAVGQGSATITAQITYEGSSYQARCSVTVASDVQPEISLNRSSLSLEPGESQTLTASVTPSGTAVSWNSSDTSVATVSDGRVTAVGQGSATITAQITYNGTSRQARCAVSVSGDGETGEWTTTKLPRKDGYEVETKVQYRFKSKELTQSTQNDLPGWTLYDTKTDYTWGNWSDWKNGTASGMGDSVQVETRQVNGATTRYYDLYYYKYWNSNFNKYYYTYSQSYATARGGTKYTASAPASECTPKQSFEGHQAYRYNGFDLWWIENTRDVTAKQDQYRTRTKTETTLYFFYRWSDWSDWKDVSVAAEDSVQVETRMLYRYIPI